MRVLLAEDDIDTGQALMKSLKDAGYGVDWVRDGVAGREAVKATEYTVALFNLGLPGISGLELLRSTRVSKNTVPVLVLTAGDELEARVESLDAGADDFIIKPFDIRELLARMRAVLRRKAGYAVSMLGDDTLYLDVSRRTLTFEDVTSLLSAREFALMHALLERPGIILSRSQLEDRMYSWGKEIGSNAVDVLIHALRRKFGQGLIRNVRGAGWTVILGNAA